jgi:phage gp36-like protein
MPEIKQPSEDLVYDFDFTGQMGGETIAQLISAVVTPRGAVAELLPLDIVDQGFSGRNARIRLEGGTDGETYLVTMLVSDSAGQRYELDAEFAVINFGFQVPTIASPYLSAQAFVERLGLDEAIRLTDTIGNGRIEVPRLATALADAQAEVDSYLAARHATPLATVPALITMIVFNLAVANLWRGELPESVRDRRDNAQRQLRDMAAGKITLPGAALLAPAEASDAPVLFSTTDRLFTRDSMKGL